MTVRQKKLKINIVLIVAIVLYSSSLFFCSNVINNLENFETNLKSSVEQSWRQQARTTLGDIINQFEYAIQNKGLDPNNIEEVAEWCDINYAGVRNGGLTSDGIVIELRSELFVMDDLINTSKEDSILKYLDEEIGNHDHLQNTKEVIKNIKKFTDTKYNDNNYWITDGVTEWLEWKVYPTNMLGKNDYLTNSGISDNEFNKYVFILSTNENEIFAYYRSVINNVNNCIFIVQYVLAIALISIISLIFYITYTEFNKGK